MSEFYHRLRNLADAHGTSFNRIERDLGYPRNALANYKQERQPSARRLAELARYFSVSQDYLLGQEDEPHVVGYTSTDDLLSKLTESRRNDVIKFIHEKLQEQGEEVELMVKNASTVLAIELVSVSGFDVWQQVNMLKRLSVPLENIPSDYDVALLIEGADAPPLIKDGELIFIKFPYGTYNGSLSAFDIGGLGLIFVETTAKDGTIFYVRDFTKEHTGSHNTGVIVGTYTTK